MRTATGLTLMAVGAIFAFAVTAQPSYLNLHITGLVLILTGLAGLVMPRRTYGWLRRRLVRRGTSSSLSVTSGKRRHPASSVLLSPSSPASLGHGYLRGERAADEPDAQAAPPDSETADEPDAQAAPLDSETVDEFIEE